MICKVVVVMLCFLQSFNYLCVENALKHANILHQHGIWRAVDCCKVLNLFTVHV